MNTVVFNDVTREYALEACRSEAKAILGGCMANHHEEFMTIITLMYQLGEPDEANEIRKKYKNSLRHDCYEQERNELVTLWKELKKGIAA